MHVSNENELINAALLGDNPNMRYYPRIQTAALKVGFHELLLHQYSKRLQTYTHNYYKIICIWGRHIFPFFLINFFILRPKENI